MLNCIWFDDYNYLIFNEDKHVNPYPDFYDSKNPIYTSYDTIFANNDGYRFIYIHALYVTDFFLFFV